LLAIILNVSQIINNEIISNFTVTQFTKMMCFFLAVDTLLGKQYQTNQRNLDVL